MERSHISVCVCTYKRPHLLDQLLKKLAEQEADDRFTFSAVIVDNDSQRSAEPVVLANRELLSFAVSYSVEPRQSIALARNRAVENATGDFIAFIDDDEIPTDRWLLTLLNACNEYNVDGVLGPVKPYFEDQPPQWVVDGKFYERQSYPTGLVIDWRKGRTGNTFLRRRIFEGLQQPFRPEFRTGEDQEFFYRMIEQGKRFVWCDEAVAFEIVPPQRWSRRFMLRRALLRGAMEPKTPMFGFGDIVKSLIAVPVYAAVLPILLVAGQAKVMNILVRLCDHLGKLLAVAGINPVKEAYVVE
jgi:succinoglycan biosynthesis protein ExoM